MFYCLYGDNTKKSREKLQSLLRSLFLKKPNDAFFKLEPDNFTENKLEELIKSQGLFENKYIVQMDGLFEDKIISKVLISKLDDLKESKNVFIFIENKISKSILKKIEEFASRVQEFVSNQSKGRTFATEKGDFKIGDFNIFDLATCFGNRNKKDLWVLYQKTRARDIPSEEVSGIIFWQLKMIFLAMNSRDASEAGLKPFVFNKAKGYLKNYSEVELKKMSANLVYIYHNARRSGLNLDLALEKFILEL